VIVNLMFKEVIDYFDKNDQQKLLDSRINQYAACLASANQLKNKLDVTHAKNPEQVKKFLCISCTLFPTDALMCGCNKLSCRECFPISV
jgi:hypothetical protein